MARILITGHTGLLGSNLYERLRTKHDVLGMSRRTGQDLRDKEVTAQTIKRFRPEYVYHLAAQAAEARSQPAPIDMTERNINIFLNVLVPCINAKIKKFIYASSVSVYGDAEVPYTEDDVPRPKNIYGINKYTCEMMLKSIAKTNGLDFVIFRPHNMYGPHQDMRNPYKNVVALFMRNIMEDKEVTIYGGGKMRRAFSYVHDVVDVFAEAINPTFDNQIFNVGSSIEYSIERLLGKVEGIAGKKMRVKRLPSRPHEVYQFISNNRKMRLVYDYNETSLDEGLQKTWEFINLPKIQKEENEISTNH